MSTKVKLSSVILIAAILAALLSVNALCDYGNTHKNTGDMASDIIAVAKSQLGYKEGQLDGTVQKGNDCTKYGEWYGLNYNPWCAMFVSWCANEAEIPKSIIPRHASCDNGMEWFIDKGGWHYSPYYGGSYEPKAGDIVYFGYKMNNGGYDSTHVGIVYSVSDTKISVYEGNSADKVQSVSYNKNNNAYILGYGSPAYTKSIIQYSTGTYITDAYSLNFRKGVGTSYDSIAVIPQGTILQVTEVKDGWGKTIYESMNGWVSLGWCTRIIYIEYNANGGTGEPEPQTKNEGTQISLSTVQPKRPGYTFMGWSSIQDGDSVEYYPGGKYMSDEDITLYAVWKYDDKYTITFDGTGGTNVPESMTVDKGATVDLPMQEPSFSCCRFLGWSSSSGSSRVDYLPGMSYTPNSSVTLYAVWDDQRPIVEITASSGGRIDITYDVIDGRTCTIVNAVAYNNYSICKIVANGRLIPISSDFKAYTHVFDTNEKIHTFEIVFLLDAPEWINPFIDINSDSWCYDAVCYASKNKYFSGISEDTFGPDIPITRGMFVTVLGSIYSNLKGDITAQSNDHFSDVDSRAYYAKYVNWAYESGIVSGTGAGMFSPDENVTREQLAVMMQKYLHLYKEDNNDYNNVTLYQYNDRNSISLWAFKSMCWAVENKVLSGISDVELSPKTFATRAQVAQTIYSLFK